MRPELPPLPASANEEPSELYQVCGPGRHDSAGIVGGGGEQEQWRLDKRDERPWSFPPPGGEAAARQKEPCRSTGPS